ncbi:HmuY family protein [Epilithonimonas sp. UC225_85]|uniref:HmuY family protein n=1 Tax=Epilithonimonas sp. UC225_85 TaxID=3350167 RepID=UPI0036D27BAE
MKKLLIYISIVSGFLFQSCINDNEDPVAVSGVGDVKSPAVGGATEPNQVWFDLSSGQETMNRRTDWDLAFYSGNSFKVILNPSILMAAAKIPNITDINLVKESDVAELKTKVQVANFDPTNVNYVDDVKGNFPTGYTAISEISPNDSDNAVYLVNLGKNIFEGDVPAGSVLHSGTDRGWMKIQITRSGNSAYKIKYAEIADTKYKEYIITKDTDHNFSFFSLKNDRELLIQPQKEKWDLCFTVFTNVIEGAGTYIYADFVLSNLLGGVAAYEVKVTAPTTGAEAYNNFTANDLDASKFITDDHRVIGGNWRNPVGTNGLEVYGDRFYVIRDAEGFYFKLRFLRMTSTSGERGHPQFEYKPL